MARQQTPEVTSSPRTPAKPFACPDRALSRRRRPASGALDSGRFDVDDFNVGDGARAFAAVHWAVMRAAYSRAAAFVAVLFVGGCGSSGPAEPSADPQDVEVAITASGVSPKEVTVRIGDRVRFRNNDTRPHAVSSDPVGTHSDCPVVNNVGTLNPGESRRTGAFPLARTCGFHDHNDENNADMQGRIIILK
jgi:plastocyanin